MEHTPKFKVGDKIRVANEPVNNGDSPCWVSEMNIFKGKKAIITRIKSNISSNEAWYQIDIDTRNFNYSERWLSLINIKAPKLYPIF